MNTVLNCVGLLLAAFAAYVVAMNYGCVIASYRNKRRGIDRCHSTVLVVPQILVILADLVFSAATARWVPRHWLLTIALADISIWLLFASLVVLPFRRK